MLPGNLGGGELLVILLIALLVLGPDKLPGAARNIGRAMSEFRRMSSGFQAELRDALQEPVSGVPTATSPPEPATHALPAAEQQAPSTTASPPAQPARRRRERPLQADRPARPNGTSPS
jgi:Tat protein translocase TatB subunit